MKKQISQEKGKKVRGRVKCRRNENVGERKLTEILLDYFIQHTLFIAIILIIIYLYLGSGLDILEHLAHSHHASLF